MNKKIFLFFIPLLFIAMTANAQGLFNGAIEKAKQARDQVEERAQLFGEEDAVVKEKIQERKMKVEEVRQKVQEKRISVGEEKRQRVQGALVSVENRFKNIVQRFNSFVDRIEQRVVSLEEMGVDMTETKNSLEDLKVQIGNLGDLIESASVEVNEELQQEEISRDAIKEIMNIVKDEVMNTKDSLKVLVEEMRADVLESRMNELTNDSELEN